MPVFYDDPQRPPRPLWRAMRRGLFGRCPSCGEAGLFDRYLKITDRCDRCGEDLHGHRADDAPPYFTILIVGHFIVGLVLSVEMTWHPPIWLQFFLWAPLTILLALLILPRVKGALVAQQWALYMHGFDPEEET